MKAGYDLHYNDNITHEYPGEKKYTEQQYIIDALV